MPSLFFILFLFLFLSTLPLPIQGSRVKMSQRVKNIAQNRAIFRNSKLFFDRKSNFQIENKFLKLFFAALTRHKKKFQKFVFNLKI